MCQIVGLDQQFRVDGGARIVERLERSDQIRDDIGLAVERAEDGVGREINGIGQARQERRQPGGGKQARADGDGEKQERAYVEDAEAEARRRAETPGHGKRDQCESDELGDMKDSLG